MSWSDLRDFRIAGVKCIGQLHFKSQPVELYQTKISIASYTNLIFSSNSQEIDSRLQSDTIISEQRTQVKLITYKPHWSLHSKICHQLPLLTTKIAFFFSLMFGDKSSRSCLSTCCIRMRTLLTHEITLISQWDCAMSWRDCLTTTKSKSIMIIIKQDTYSYQSSVKKLAYPDDERTAFGIRKSIAKNEDQSQISSTASWTVLSWLQGPILFSISSTIALGGTPSRTPSHSYMHKHFIYYILDQRRISDSFSWDSFSLECTRVTLNSLKVVYLILSAVKVGEHHTTDR